MKRTSKPDPQIADNAGARSTSFERGAGAVPPGAVSSAPEAEATRAVSAEHRSGAGRRLAPRKTPPSAASQRSHGTEPDEVAEEIRWRAARRKRVRSRVRMRALMVLIPSLLISAFLMAATHVVLGDWRHWQSEVSARETQLAALDTQLEIGRRRLATLQAPKGREQLLIEHGYLPPGDRILLFAPSAPQKRALAPNDVAPHQEEEQAPTGSALSRATRSIGEWWRTWRGP